MLDHKESPSKLNLKKKLKLYYVFFLTAMEQSQKRITYETGKYENKWRLNSELLNTEWFIEQIKKKFWKQMKMTTQHTKTYIAKAMLRGNFIATSAGTKKRERHEMNDLPMHLKAQPTKPTKTKISRKKGNWSRNT